VNHFGDLMCRSAVPSSKLPGNDDVVDTGLFSFGLTPTSGTAERFGRHGNCQQRSFGATHVSWLTGSSGPTFTTGRGQARSGRDPPRSSPSRPATRTRADSFGRLLNLPGAADNLRRFVRQACRSANSGLSAWDQLVNVGATLTRLGPADARVRERFISASGVLARHTC
jgi:hypothetical protein